MSPLMRRPCARIVLCAPVVAALAIACGGEPAAKADPAAKVANPVSEGSLTTITLSEIAERRLGIATVAVESRKMTPTRVSPGELIAVPGNTQSLTAPVAGRILAPEGGAIPLPGARPDAGEALLRLVPVAPDRDLMRADEELKVAAVRYQQSQLEADRAEALWKDRLISARDREQTIADLAVAVAARDAAAGRARQASGSAEGAATAEGVSSLVVRAPFTGVVQRLLVGAEQIVAAGTPLVELSRTNEMWVRVTVYVGDLARVDTRANAGVRIVGAGASGHVLQATPVASPGTADAASASAELHYRLRNPDGDLRPGGRVEVSVPLRGAGAEARAVPWAAVLFDAEGGAWVYERTGERQYTRRRVVIGLVRDGWAEVRSGVPLGAMIVTDGSAELFGTEFGAGK